MNGAEGAESNGGRPPLSEGEPEEITVDVTNGGAGALVWNAPYCGARAEAAEP
jgi:hypothetical protein